MVDTALFLTYPCQTPCKTLHNKCPKRIHGATKTTATCTKATFVYLFNWKLRAILHSAMCLGSDLEVGRRARLEGQMFREKLQVLPQAKLRQQQLYSFTGDNIKGFGNVYSILLQVRKAVLHCHDQLLYFCLNPIYHCNYATAL